MCIPNVKLNVTYKDLPIEIGSYKNNTKENVIIYDPNTKKYKITVNYGKNNNQTIFSFTQHFKNYELFDRSITTTKFDSTASLTTYLNHGEVIQLDRVVDNYLNNINIATLTRSQLDVIVHCALYTDNAELADALNTILANTISITDFINDFE